ncbi:MAG: hypothetical protein HYS41_07305 [Candidatus Omnitrophica bacterium]|nr:hypothetical protein [Candidatus Omnitrophota bacterium]
MAPKKEKVVLAVLAALAAVVWVRGLTARPARPQRSAAAPSLSGAAVRGAGQGAQKMTSRFTEWADSPFLVERRGRPDTKAVQVPDSGGRALAVSGILWDPKGSSAIVNGLLVGVGDEVGGWKVLEIQRDKVVLTDGANLETLTVE